MTNQIDSKKEYVDPTDDEFAEDRITGPECCRTCTFFAFGYLHGKLVPELAEPNDSTKGTCSINPPVLLITMDGLTSGQPDTFGFSWCGKYQRGEPRNLPKC